MNCIGTSKMACGSRPAGRVSPHTRTFLSCWACDGAGAARPSAKAPARTSPVMRVMRSSPFPFVSYDNPRDIWSIGGDRHLPAHRGPPQVATMPFAVVLGRGMDHGAVVPQHEVARPPAMRLDELLADHVCEQLLLQADGLVLLGA